MHQVGVEIPYGKGQFLKAVRPMIKALVLSAAVYAAERIIQSSITA